MSTAWPLNECPTCHGHGTVPLHRDLVSGRWHDEECPTCKGTGDHTRPHDARPYLLAVVAALLVAAVAGVWLHDPARQVAVFAWALGIAIAVAGGVAARRGVS